MIDGGHVLGDPQGVAERKHLHGRADSHALGAGRDVTRQRHRCRVHGTRGIEMDFAEPHAVEP